MLGAGAAGVDDAAGAVFHCIPTEIVSKFQRTDNQ